MTHLELLNVALTWRFKQPRWPPVLDQSAYLVHGVGLGLVLPENRRVVPDIVASCTERDISLLVEVKSGGGLDRDQLDRMLALTPEDLRDLNHITIRNLTSHRVQVLYVCNSAEIDGFKIAVAGRPRVAVVGFDGSRYTLVGDLADRVLAEKLGEARVDPEGIPAAIVPFDHESLIAAVARHVLPEVVAALVAGSGTITSDGIVRRTHHLVYEVMRPTGATSELRQISRRVTEVLRDAANNEFMDWLERLAPDPTWRFKRALAYEPKERTRDLKALRSAADALLTRLGAPTSQLALFDAEDI